MTEIALQIDSGGRLEVHGSLAAKQIFVILSRENFLLDEELVARLVHSFADRNLTVIRYDSRIAVTTRLIDRKCFHVLPQRVRRGLKAFLLLFLPAHWRHFSARYRNEQNSIAYRTRSLIELIEFLGADKDIILLTRSAGGRVASLVADQLGIKKIVCLGYPFHHPDEAPDPTRYAHLENVQTPFLILQGLRDAYGGREITGKYRFAPNTTIQWVDTDHDFAMPSREWTRVIGLIDDFILQREAENHTAAISEKNG